MKHNINLSILLPVYNEKENLEFLIPELVKVCEEVCAIYEIIVIDDSPNDETAKLMESYIELFINVKYVVRVINRSLPLSILEGIHKSKFENVMWLDADGSMDSSSVRKLIEKFQEDKNVYIIGSRFVSGGGYKGQLSGNSTIFESAKNIKNSEDSILAIYLSIIFNKFLQFLISTNVRDLTSGFIIGKKSLIKESVFAQSNYGEYFIYLVVDLLKQGQQIVEIGYICKPRLYGKSKTSNNLLTLIRLGLPYIKAALKCRMTINTKNKSQM